MRQKFTNATKYFGYLTVIVEWLGALLLITIKHPNLSEPFSQYGFYSATKLLFGTVFTLAAIIYYLFSRHLNRYWEHTSLISFIAGVFFAITGWIPYSPAVHSFIFDIHNAAIVTAVILYSTPMIFIGYKKKHERIARTSRVLYIFMLVMVGWSVVARLIDSGVIYAQLASIIPFHIWLVMTNKLLLEDLTQTPATTKL